MDRVKSLARALGVDIARAQRKIPLIERAGSDVSLDLVGEVFAFFDRVPYFYGEVIAPLRIGGAWRADLLDRRREQIRLIEQHDAKGYQALASRMMFNELVSGLWNYGYYGERTSAHDAVGRSAEAFTNMAGLNIGALDARTSLAVWGASIDGRLVTNVAVSHAAQAWAVSLLLPESGIVVDLGSGFGGMAEKLIDARRDARLVLIDIPANLTTAYLYLASRFDGVKLCAREADIVTDARFLLVPTTLVAATAEAFGSFDVVHNAGSFSEMDAATIAYYLETLVANRARRLIETNSNRATVNTGGHAEVLSSRFPIPASHRLIARYSPIDREASAGRYITSIYERSH